MPPRWVAAAAETVAADRLCDGAFKQRRHAERTEAGPGPGVRLPSRIGPIPDLRADSTPPTTRPPPPVRDCRRGPAGFTVGNSALGDVTLAGLRLELLS